MLGITGRAADGWLPSLPYLKAGDLARGNAIIDAAAIEAGRDGRCHPPAAQRQRPHHGHGPWPAPGAVSQWVEELTEFAIEDGIGTFIVMGDDAATMERLGAEVVPAVREAVAAARLAGLPWSSVPSRYRSSPRPPARPSVRAWVSRRPAMTASGSRS